MLLAWEFRIILALFVDYLIKKSDPFNPVIGEAINFKNNLRIVNGNLVFGNEGKEGEKQAKKFRKKLIELCDKKKCSNHAEACILLGLYYLSVERRKSKDKDKITGLIYDLFSKAAAANHPWGIFCVGLQHLYYDLPDLLKEHEKIKISRDIGNAQIRKASDHHLSIAKICLATTCCGFGRGCEASNSLVRDASKLGDPFAYFLLGFYAQHGLANYGVNIPKAVQYYRAAASSGHILAIFKLAEIYETGPNGFPANLREAFRLYKQVIEEGYNRSPFIPFLTRLTMPDVRMYSFQSSMLLPVDDLYRSYYSIAKSKCEYYKNYKTEICSFFNLWNSREFGGGCTLPVDIIDYISDYAFNYSELSEKSDTLKVSIR